MMVDPEWYYEEYLKGKSVEQIRSRIRSLQRKIRQLQKEVDVTNINFAPDFVSRLDLNSNGRVIYEEEQEDTEEE